MVGFVFLIWRWRKIPFDLIHRRHLITIETVRPNYFSLLEMLSFSQVSDWAIVSLNCLEVYWAQPIISLPEELHFWTRHTQRCDLLSNWLVPNFLELLCIAGPKTKILWQRTDLRFYLHSSILFFFFSFFHLCCGYNEIIRTFAIFSHFFIETTRKEKNKNISRVWNGFQDFGRCVGPSSTTDHNWRLNR